MKKSFSLYAIGWLAVLGLFNVITFVTPSEIDGISKFDTLFWVAYAFITLTFVGQLVCSYFVFQEKNLQKVFYNISLFRISITGLVTMLIVGSICMAVIQIPEWVGVIACCAVLVLNIVAVVKATLGISAIAEIDKKIKVKTLFIKMLTADATVLMQNTSDPALAPIAKKVYEAVRYSDPMSDDALASVEDRISEQFSAVSGAIDRGDATAAEAEAVKLQKLLNERNAKCKILK